MELCSHSGLTAVLLIVGCLTSAVMAQPGAPPSPPMLLQQTSPVEMIVLPDGSYAFYIAENPDEPVVLEAGDGTKVTLEPRMSSSLLAGTRGRLTLVGQDGELHQVYAQRSGTGRPAEGLNIDLWHRKTSGGQEKWEEPKMAWEGYTGAMMEYMQLKSGRILVPFGKWIGGRPVAPPIGCHETMCVYSDDHGETWQQTGSRLIAPCYPDFNGNNYGACEPAVAELTDGRIYMLMRTQTGFLYESWSDDGAEWSTAEPSRFHSSTSPPGLTRLPDGRILVLWNNCEMPPRVEGAGVYGGRDALHAAISDDGGNTWRGFREVYRDPMRNETPPKRGDRGTAYPYGAFDGSGMIVLRSGQGAGRRNLVRVDPDWITLTRDETDFSRGLEDWHVFKPFGPAAGYWRDRTIGPELVDHPDKPGAKALHLRRPDEKDPDGAAWNFPLGWKGTLKLRLRLGDGFGGATIALADRLFEPTDPNGERLAIFPLQVAADGKLSTGATLSPDAWHDVSLTWDLDARSCAVSVDGKPAGKLEQAHSVPNGISYLRLRSAAESIDEVGFLVESVSVDISDPAAPPRTLADNRANQAEYLSLIEGHRSRDIIPPKAKTGDAKEAAPLKLADGFAMVEPVFADAKPVPDSFCGGFLVALKDGRLLNVYREEAGMGVSYSADDGRTWTPPGIISSPEEGVSFGRPSALQTEDGTIWLFTYGFVKWSPDPAEARSDMWAACSKDAGKTWQKPRIIWQGYTGMTQGAIETSAGNLLVPFCYLGPQTEGFSTVRFIAGCILSTDGGKTWRLSGGLQVPPEADAEMRKRVNGGSLEPTVVELGDGRVRMFVRTVTGHLWAATSTDSGKSWSELQPTKLTCGGPVYATRLPSNGYLALVWNQADWAQAAKWSGWPNGYAKASIALSGDDGETWHNPVVFASGGGRSVHSMVTEYAPGKLMLNMPARRFFLTTTEERLTSRDKDAA